MLERNDNFNQRNYTSNSDGYSKIKLNSTMYLAYRDLHKIIEKYLSPEMQNKTLKVLDYGCGPGTSTEILINIFKQLNIKVNIVGVDINEENIETAKKNCESYDNVVFMAIKKEKFPKVIRNFDFALCNFVLLENNQNDITSILENINHSLKDGGKLIVTNTTARAYHSNNKWYSLDNNFEENNLRVYKNGKWKLEDGQKVKLKLHDHKTHSSFVVTDFFYSGKFYQNAYKTTGYSLLGVEKPIAHESDDLYPELKSEKTTPPYKIHILSKTTSLDLVCEPRLMAKL